MDLPSLVELGCLSPTSVADLQSLLTDFLRDLSGRLRDNFCGLYLQGSFALGAADEHSDLDFVVVTHGRVDANQRGALEELHVRLADSPVSWSQHMEGSYVPIEKLWRISSNPQGWLYIDNGSRDIEVSTHDDTAVMRWILREHGVTLAGPQPTTLIDVVPCSQLRAEARTTERNWAAELVDNPHALNSALAQQQHVLALCRLAFTLSECRVASKDAAGRWALNRLDASWQTLIDRALSERPNPWLRARQPADPAVVDRTRLFQDYVGRWADNQTET